MADNSAVHIAESSPEDVAYKLLLLIGRIEKQSTFANRKTVLDTYVECLKAVRGERKA